jgi:hypothetical protein
MEHSTSRADGVAILRIAGVLDAVTAAELRPSVNAPVAERHPRSVVDGGMVTVQSMRDQPLAVFKRLPMDRVPAAWRCWEDAR